MTSSAKSLRSALSAVDSSEQVAGDTGGLPLELWRVVLSYVPVSDLARCSQVCKAWRHLVASLDNTTWKRHFLLSDEWRHPAWPATEWCEGWTWQNLYRENRLAARLWSLSNRQVTEQAACITLIRRKRECKTILVGANKEHRTLKSALAVAGEYDRILISPGVYDEQFEMSSKIPFELMGSGPLGSVVLVMCVEQNALTGRLCNLVLKAPWFTTHVIKVVNGHLQIDNCRVEEGQVIVQSPGTCHFRYCFFNKLQVSLHSTRISIIENCEFTNCTSTALCVEGYPTDDTNWAHEHLSRLVHLIGSQRDPKPNDIESQMSESDLTSLSEKNSSHDKTGSGKSRKSQVVPPSEEVDSIGVASIAGSQMSLSDAASLAPSFESSISSRSLASRGRGSRPEEFYSDKAVIKEPRGRKQITLPVLDLSDTDSDVTTSSDNTTMLRLSGSCDQISNLWSDGEETYMEANLQMVLQESIYSDTDLVAMATETAGPVVRRCKFTRCHGGITVSRQGQIRVEKCDFHELQFAIRCLQNAKVAVLENTIHHCTTSGIFMRLAAHGVIAGNDIYCTNEAGIDVRKSADPLIQCNKIHHSKRSGIVVLGSGHGTIKSNDIYQNKEAGIYILYRGNPHITGNRIVHGGAAGIAVSEGGRGYIIENLISRNRWGGVDIRHSGDPHITHNLICNGLADGIVIGQKGKGTIEGNTVKGNAGCGLWVMGGQPLIQMNQIYNNNDTGVSFVQHKETDDDYSADEAEDSQSDHSLDVDNILSETESSIEQQQPPRLQYPQLLYNTIYHNKGYGVLAHCGEVVHMSGNAIHANRNIGIYIRQLPLVNVINNSITANAGSGLQVAAEATVKLEGNGVYDNKGHGVVVAGEATVHDNDIFSNEQCALLLQASARVQVSGNRIHAPKEDGISIADSKVKGHIHDNKLYQGEGQMFTTATDTSCQMTDNEILKREFEDTDHDGPSPDWHLTDPPPRPHIQAPPPIVPRSPVKHITTVTRVLVPSSGNCQQGSKMCVIL